MTERRQPDVRVPPGTVLLGMLVALTIAQGFTPQARAQFSPGALSRPHETLEGTLKCLECHGRREQDLRERCLVCHQEISWLTANGRGFHGRQDTGNCSSCHVEHAGRDASLIHFDEGDPERFDHARAGWPLTGKHASTPCRDCHKAEFRKSEAARLSKRENPENSFIGLETECTACHVDPHRGSLDPECRQCHLTTAWSATPGFDHSKTAYPLTGRHASVACEKCHRQPATALADSAVKPRVFKPLPHGQCSSCHRDVHQGKAGPACASCHVTDNFRLLRDVTFDHARTEYPLEGKHLQVACEKCHVRDSPDGLGAAGVQQAGAVRRLPHERCSDCHADAHGGQLVNRPDRGDCASCHRVQGWKPSTFGLNEHAALPFSLEGRHATIQCVACHAPNSKGPALTIPVETLGSARVALALGQPACVACHTDPHRGRFEAGGARPRERGCRGCHGLDAFRPSTLLAGDHAGLGFPLRGAHGTVACDRCHKEIRPRDSHPPQESSLPRPATPLLFAAENSCEACHRSKNPHGDQFARRRDHGACGSCHGEQAFKPASGFDHDRDTRFPLLRSHGKVECLKCHESNPGPSGQLFVKYSPTTFDCKECHRLTAPSLPERATRFSKSDVDTSRKSKRRRRRQDSAQ